MDVAKGDIVGGRQEASIGAKYEGGDAEESGLELVGGGDEQSMVEAPLKSNDSWEVQRCTEEFILENTSLKGWQSLYQLLAARSCGPCGR